MGSALRFELLVLAFDLYTVWYLYGSSSTRNPFSQDDDETQVAAVRVETRRAADSVSQEMSALPIDDGNVLKEDCLNRFMNSSYKTERFCYGCFY